MTNGEKYKSAKERAEAFYRDNEMPDGAYADVLVVMDWLDLEAPAENPLPCPFCGYECYGCEDHGEFWVQCRNGECDYTSASRPTLGSAIAAHNRVAKAVKEEVAK